MPTWNGDKTRSSEGPLRVSLIEAYWVEYTALQLDKAKERAAPYAIPGLLPRSPLKKTCLLRAPKYRPRPHCWLSSFMTHVVPICFWSEGRFRIVWHGGDNANSKQGDSLTSVRDHPWRTYWNAVLYVLWLRATVLPTTLGWLFSMWPDF